MCVYIVYGGISHGLETEKSDFIVDRGLKVTYCGLQVNITCRYTVKFLY